MKIILTDIVEAMANLQFDKCISLVKEKLSANIPARDILVDGLIPGLKKVGEKFESMEYFLSDLLFAAYIMNECMKILEPKLKEAVEKMPVIGKAVVGTVKGDIHDIGKNLFIILMKAAGFEVIDLGVDVSAEKFVEAVKEHKPDILGMSALLSTTAGYFKTVVEALKEAGLRDKLYIMIGGPPHVTAEEVGADIYCNDAFVGVRKALEYMETRRKQ
jgi:5-methyltetrahydrofolate--homocysteine methyltransferase